MRTTLLTTAMFLAATTLGFASEKPTTMPDAKMEKKVEDSKGDKAKKHHEKKEKMKHKKDKKSKEHNEKMAAHHDEKSMHKDGAAKTPGAKPTNADTTLPSDSPLKKASSVLDTKGNFDGEFGRNS